MTLQQLFDVLCTTHGAGASVTIMPDQQFVLLREIYEVAVKWMPPNPTSVKFDDPRMCSYLVGPYGIQREA